MYYQGVPADQWMTSEAAAAHLGVKPQTLYAYVSRGAVRSERVPGTRRSRFLRVDVERLGAKRRGGGRAGGLEVIVESDLTLLDPTGHLYYRGWDVAEAIAAGATFEEVAAWLWSGERVGVAFAAPPAMTEAAQNLVQALVGQPRMDLMRAVIAAIRHADPLRDDRRPAAVGMTARALIAAVVAVLPLSAGATEAPADGSIARRLWPRLSPLPATTESVRLLDAALVLLADHELAASTLAARVAASTWADPYLVVLAGLAALGGPLHGGASRAARRLIREVDTGASSAAEALGRRLREDQLVAGFGHRIYLAGDPRADILLRLLAGTGDDHRAEQSLIATVVERGLSFPNIDFAVAALTERYDMSEEAEEIIFSIARMVGWLGHTAEEYQYRLRFRTRAVYTGPPPR